MKINELIREKDEMQDILQVLQECRDLSENGSEKPTFNDLKSEIEKLQQNICDQYATIDEI